ESWQKCAELVAKCDKELCEGYREQIETLIVLAGLVSAVVTAFTVESYKWLQNDSGDRTVQLLAHIANLLDDTGPPILPPSTSAIHDAAAVRINVYWFLSLTLSLSSALVGILAKQWINEYDRDAGRTHPEAMGIRQMKYDSLDTWRVSEIVHSVPLLLELAIGSFLIGMLELLWQLNTLVAGPIILVAGVLGVFYLATTILPAIHFVYWLLRPASTQCPYKSPQAWIIVRVT
ncbi:hypothetical protein AURDEDRAFT_25043, partial [Auricularia subglabra TFB-10046 SS5]